MNWLDDFVNQHAELESPISFWKWSALAAISAVVKDQIWMNRYIYNLYPNIYVMLHADSGLKKGPPVSAAGQMVSAVGNTRVIKGRSSIQGILKDLGTGHTEPGGKVVSTSTAFICSSELASSIVEDPVATTILTDLYDRQYNVGEWRSLLKSESFNLKNPTVTMLTATNEAMTEGFFAKKDVQGGYFARTFIIFESKRNKKNSLAFPLTRIPNYKASAEYLKELSKLKGPFADLASLERTEEYCYMKEKDGRTIYFSEAGHIYDDWYENFMDQIDEQEIRDETGTLNRFGDSVLKVAMLLSLSRAPDLIISGEAMHEAIQTCETLVGNIRKTTFGKKGLSDDSQFKALILQEFVHRDNHAVSQEVLMRKLWMHYSDAKQFYEIMASFEGAGLITTVNMGNKIVYQMPHEKAEKLKRFFAGKLQEKE